MAALPRPPHHDSCDRTRSSQSFTIFAIDRIIHLFISTNHAVKSKGKNYEPNHNTTANHTSTRNLYPNINQHTLPLHIFEYALYTTQITYHNNIEPSTSEETQFISCNNSSYRTSQPTQFICY